MGNIRQLWDKKNRPSQEDVKVAWQEFEHGVNDFLLSDPRVADSHIIDWYEGDILALARDYNLKIPDILKREERWKRAEQRLGLDAKPS